MTKKLGLGVIKLEFILKLKIKRNDWLLADSKQSIVTLYFEFETVLEFYNREVRSFIILSNTVQTQGS